MLDDFLKTIASHFRLKHVLLKAAEDCRTPKAAAN